MSAQIALIDYGAGNLRSVANALAHLGIGFEITADPEAVLRADKVIFPGVGAAASCMRELRARGLVEALRECRQPVLGICLGMQCLTEWSAEGEGVECLAMLPGRAVRFSGDVKVPQIGWNSVEHRQSDHLFDGIPSGERFYFLHSYRVETDREWVLAETDYGEWYPCAVRRENFRGVQFHLEKSGPPGLRVLENFVHRC